ncbi:MAG: hypothetical protein SFW07_05455 [Gammaproteobacteria bacterium]|nr:hypothetical protein [Gammaproteobacteria bacterium]
MSYEEDSSSYSPSSSSSSEEPVSKKRPVSEEDPQLAELDELRETQKDIRELLKKLEYYQKRSQECTEQLMTLRESEKGILSRVTQPVKKAKTGNRKKTHGGFFSEEPIGSAAFSLSERFNRHIQESLQSDSSWYLK